jgi:hypothetical protein
MYVRVVRFTDVSTERLDGVVTQIKAAEGPPPGVRSTGIQMLFDETQATAVVLQYFSTRDDMDEGGRVLSAMDSGETPGTRVSIDTCELVLDLEAP